jgi:inorganic pyrophosphatase
VDSPSASLLLACGYLGRWVRLTLDRPAGSRHPERGFRYPVNYGHVPGVIAPDGEELDAYHLTGCPAAEAEGLCIAVIHRYFDDDDKLVVVDDRDAALADAEIHRLVAFQELPGQYEIVRGQLTVPPGKREARPVFGEAVRLRRG